MLKLGSSNVLWLCLTLQVPFANLVFAIPGMPKGKPTDIYNGIALVVILGGLILYRFYPVLQNYFRGYTSVKGLPDVEVEDA